MHVKLTMNRNLLIGILGALIAAGCAERRAVVVQEPVPASGPVIITQAPPPPVVETIGRPPSPSHVWISGYQEWNGRRYVWHRGHWAQRPRPRAVYVEGHYERRPGGWVWVPGTWR
jgi:hypothetical protein